MRSPCLARYGAPRGLQRSDTGTRARRAYRENEHPRLPIMPRAPHGVPRLGWRVKDPLAAAGQPARQLHLSILSLYRSRRSGSLYADHKATSGIRG
jgi:hypothetical protein